MAKSFFFTTLPFSAIAEHLAKDEEFQANLRTLAGLSEQDFQRLAQRLESSESFLDRQRIESILRSELPEDQSAPEELAYVVWRVSELLAEAEEQPRIAFGRLAEAVKESIPSDPQQQDVVLNRLYRLVMEPEGLALQHKAKSLTASAGRKLQSFRFLYDIRPVFNDVRSEIAGAVVVATLDLQMEENGFPTVMELRLTEEQVQEFCDKAELAKQKLEVIRETLHDKSIKIPKIRG